MSRRCSDRNRSRCEPETCDAHASHAAALITWFQVNGQAGDGATEFVQLLVEWATSVLVPPLDEVQLQEEIELWRRGEL
ncbi:DUF6300 family protein [Nonomuraea purpurea]|uniref:DUF6300 family protein n=1 Tax=Nonomuraea purpurea TaxID=1849276 RepID=A0ABV8GFN5_9ACTN